MGAAEEEELQQEEPATEDADSAEGSQVDADADADAESAEEASESASEQEPLRFGATSTVAPFQTSGSLLIPRVRDDEVEPERSLRLLNLDTRWLHSEQRGAASSSSEEEQSPVSKPEREAWRTDDGYLHARLQLLEKEIEQKHQAWKVAAGLCVPVEQLQPTNGDPARAKQIQDEIQDRLQQIAALHRERAEFRRRVAEAWRAEDPATAQAVLTKRTNAWRYVVTDAHQKRRAAAARVARQLREELSVALRPWSTPEAAEQKLGTKLDDSVRMFLVDLKLEAYSKAFEAERYVSTSSLQNLKRPALEQLLRKVGLTPPTASPTAAERMVDAVWRALHPGACTRDDILAAFEAAAEVDEDGAFSGILDLRGKVIGSKAAKLLGALLGKLTPPLPYA